MFRNEIILLGISTLLSFSVMAQSVATEAKTATTVKEEESDGEDILQFRSDHVTSRFRWVKEEKSVDEDIRLQVDKQAEFPGGEKSKVEFLKENVKYPEEALENDIEGTVLLDFVVKKDSTIDDIRVIKSVHSLLDAEAIRVVKLMPKWVPAEYQGNPCSSRVKQVFYFKLKERLRESQKK
ncbi:MAG: energy transducer TonB [Paludibacteraceae bacterium]|nr:energy transducer TonB [Paludibacteraceae bacterium]